MAARILKAAHVAAVWHANQRRKGSAQEPYVNHLLEVAQLVAESPEGRNDESLIIAALLHDAIEDAKIPYACIAEMFGADVAHLVQEVTDDKALAKQERKRLQIVNAPHKSQRAALLKLADKTSNLRAVANDPPVHWPSACAPKASRYPSRAL
jgi:(p)ppGpp synthase/HD superfamily hydrolase